MISTHSGFTTRKIISRRAKRKAWSRIFWFLYGLFVTLFLVAGIFLGATYLYFTHDLPKISSIEDYRPPIVSTVYSDDGRVIAEFFNERRIVVPLSKMPRMLIHAFIAAEDARFYKHKGIDILSIIRAFFKNIEAGTIVQGGSTITQQVTKSLFLTPERSYSRKVREAILAYRLDNRLTKDEILFLYLNQIYLGDGSYGVEAAAENYFGKSVSELNLAECAMLAGLPRAPSRYSPFKHPERARERQAYVLKRMVEEGYITEAEAQEALDTKLEIKPRRNLYTDEVPYYTEYVRQYVQKKYGRDVLYNEGLRIYTGVNIEMQKVGTAELNKGLKALDKRMGYRGPLKHLDHEEIDTFCRELQQNLEGPVKEGETVKGVVTGIDNEKGKVTVCIGDEEGIILLRDMRWARKPDPEIDYREARVKHPGDALSIGDVILVRVKGRVKGGGVWNLALEQTPLVEGALLCMEADTGYVKVLVGGRDFKVSEFNRAIQSRRQPGSAFKPIIYAAALDKGYTPATIIIDSPLVFQDSERDFVWKPKNYEEKFYGPTIFRSALIHSRNIVTIKILKDIGIDYVIQYARKLGITSPISRDLSIALGSSGVSLLELVRAYSVFVNQGQLVKPIFVTKIIDRYGNILEENLPQRKRVIEKSTAFIMTNLLQGVVREGTGRRVRKLNRPAAGKTGTTNNLVDAWFVGFTPRYITGVWVGFDDERSLGKNETGSRAAAPIWLGFMKRVLKDKPIRVFPVPDNVVFAKIDAKTGLLAIPESEQTFFECFKEGTVPTEYTKKPGLATKPDQFFKSDF
nr:penicillin-binding protein 1A [Desulfobacterales bacterium]